MGHRVQNQWGSGPGVGRWIARTGALALFTLAVLHSGLVRSEIVLNGGFENGDFSGFTLSGDNSNSNVECPGAPFALQGKCQAFFGPEGSIGTLSQSISTLAGTTYEISFQLKAVDESPSSFSAFFGSSLLISLINPSASASQRFNFFAPAIDSTTSLSFNFRDDFGFILLDAVSVVPVRSTSIPEPGTIALIGISFAALVLTRRRLSECSKPGSISSS